MSTSESTPTHLSGATYARVDLNAIPETTLSPSQGLWIWPLTLLAGAYTDIWLEREDLGIYVTVAVCVLARCLGK
jgi:hypothetical protein